MDSQIPVIEVTNETRRAYKGRRPCKNFFTKKGCAFGVKCHFLHDEEPNPRDYAAIRLDPGCDGGTRSTGNGPTSKPSNRKTRICNRWGFTGYCPYESKCNFAHGMAELQPYRGGLMEKVIEKSSSVPGFAGYGIGFPSQGASNVAGFDGHGISIPSPGASNVAGQLPSKKFEGPNNMSD